MARSFVRASSQAAINASALGLTAYPFTFACWFNPSSTSLDGSSSYALMSLGQQSGTPKDTLLWLEDNGSSNSVIAAFNETGTITGRAQSSQPTAETWQHACAVFASNTSRSAYYNGGNKATNTDNITFPSTSLNFRIAARAIGDDHYYDGALAEVAVWNVALDDAEVAALGKGVAPPLIRPASLIAYWPLFGHASPELDRWRSKLDLTLTNAPTKTDHPRMFYAVGAQ